MKRLPISHTKVIEEAEQLLSGVVDDYNDPKWGKAKRHALQANLDNVSRIALTLEQNFRQSCKQGGLCQCYQAAWEIRNWIQTLIQNLRKGMHPDTLLQNLIRAASVYCERTVPLF